MKKLARGLTLSLAIFATAAKAEQTLTVDGTEYPLSTLMATCQAIADDPAAQITCFGDISRMLEEQTAEAQEPTIGVPEALAALRAAAEYVDGESGLKIVGSDCNIQILYFNNYFHLSRRNISTLDLFSAQFDASQLPFDEIVRIEGAPAPLSKGFMFAGETALVHGGVALDSAQLRFAPKSPRASIDSYASEVVSQLQGRESQAFEFALVHPQRNQASDEIWDAFEDFLKACKQ